jgi:hypothetical protein
MRRIILALTLSLSLAGCAGLAEKVLNLPAGVLATSVSNPVAPVNIYQAKTVYAATLELANGYRDYCYSKPFAALMADPVSKPVCKSRRAIVRAMTAADDKAAAAIQTADNFVINNPTLDATSAIRAAIAAVAEFQNIATITAKGMLTNQTLAATINQGAAQ